MKLQLVAVGTKMPDWVQTGFSELSASFSKRYAVRAVWKSPPVSAVKMPISSVILEKEGK
ncbi:Ribosomal RNA large subunit methyltransferase H [Raoultella terrigena]|nr:Ribosomal RNA large subunit methyltransferase H [Raoultella terrigena]